MFRLPANPGEPWERVGHVADVEQAAVRSGHVTHTRLSRRHSRQSEILVLTELQALATTETIDVLRQRISQRLGELGATSPGPRTLLELFSSVCGWGVVPRSHATFGGSPATPGVSHTTSGVSPAPSTMSPPTSIMSPPASTMSPHHIATSTTSHQHVHLSTSPTSDTSAPHSITPVTTNGSSGSTPSVDVSQTSDRPSVTATSKMSRQFKSQLSGSTQIASVIPSASKGYYANLDTSPGITLAKLLSSSPEYALRESYFQKCFPMHRKQFEHSTQPRSFLRTPRFKKVLISPDCNLLAMVADKHWEVFKVGENFNHPPVLHCEGQISGVYGRLSESRYPKRDRYAKVDDSEDVKKSHVIGPADLGDFEWDFIHASLSNRYLAITGTKGMVRVFDLEKLGKPIYTYRSDFNAQAIALSGSGSLLVCSITGRDLKTDAVKPMIALHDLRRVRVRRERGEGKGEGARPDGARADGARADGARPDGVRGDRRNSNARRDSISTSTISRTSTTRTTESTHSNSSSSTFGLSRGSPTTLTTPYTDPVTRLIISAQETSILCATETQSRFFVIDVQSPVEPRLIMKSARRADPSPESEGITDLAFFPNQQVVVVASLAKESPPIVVDTNVRNLHPALPPTSVSQPSLLSRLDPLGSHIHCVAVSPRGDAMAFVDKTGLVYVVFLDPHTYAARKTVLVAEVGGAHTAYEAAALRFSADGQVLFAVDYKGVFHVQDWGAGLPSYAGVGKCQTLRANKS